MRPVSDEAKFDSRVSAPERLRFAVMCRGLDFPEWQARCLRAILELGKVEPVLLILDRRPAAPRSSAWKRASRLLRLKVNLYSIYNSHWVSRQSVASRPASLSAILGHLPQLECDVLRKGKFSEYFREDDLSRIRSFNPDFILRFGFGIIRGDILNVPRFGVWSFHHGDEQKYRGAPPCFWEIYHPQPQTGAMLQRLTERLDGGIVLKKGWFETIRHSYPANRDAAHFLGVPWPAQVCADILAGRAEYVNQPPVTTSAPVYLLPTNRQMVMFGLKQIWHCGAHWLRAAWTSDERAPRVARS